MKDITKGLTIEKIQEYLSQQQALLTKQKIALATPGGNHSLELKKDHVRCTKRVVKQIEKELMQKVIAERSGINSDNLIVSIVK